MKKTLFILGGIAVLCLLLIVRSFYMQNKRMTDERQWFVKSLRYDFSARVDSVRALNEQTRKLWCSVTSGDPQPHLEDSLKNHFKEHDMLYLIFDHSGDSIVFLVSNGKDIREGDSVVVSSGQDEINFYRDGEMLASDPLSEMLTGFSRPFFMKKKE